VPDGTVLPDPSEQDDAHELPWSARNPGGREMNPRLERIGGRTEDFVDSVESAIGKAVPRRLHPFANARSNTVVNVVWRAGVLIVGLSLMSAGLLMLVLPGPGWGAIILGLVVLASEYAWANRLLKPVQAKARAAAARARRMSRRQQAFGAAALLLALVAVSIAAWWYMDQYGLHLPWS
jgi:uncharacterized protein (TIGR02611 family)